MAGYEDLRVWSKYHDLILNRVHVLEGLTGGVWTVWSRGIRWRCEWSGHRIADWVWCDVRSVKDAYDRLDAVTDWTWYLTVEGAIT